MNNLAVIITDHYPVLMLVSFLMIGALLGAVTLGVGVTTTIQVTYLPQFIGFTIGTVPTSISIRVLGDGTTIDLNGNGITAVTGFMQLGAIANNFTLAIADGLIVGKNVEITIVNADAAGFNLFGWSMKRGANYLVYQRQTILANSGVDFTDFTLLAVQAPGATDQFTLSYEDGTVENASLNEIQFALQYVQNNQGATLIDNTGANLMKVNILPAAQRVAFMAKWQPVGNIDNAPISSTEELENAYDEE